ncbi:MAG: LicD family protein [Lachnospiraceae bacterium]|nr:LicD family protein [Lachnospiraceae bacterium]
MTNQDFNIESKKYIDDVYSEFCEYQRLVWNIFVWFNHFCKKHEIQYFMGFGSLIGVIRDKGCIPWDYDIDVIVKINEKDKLIQLLELELPDSMYYTYSTNVEEYPTCCLRICQKGFPFTSIHLDVYFLIGNPKKEPQNFVDNIENYHILREIKYGDKWYPQEFSNDKKNLKLQLLRLYREFRKITISANKIKFFEERILKQYPLGSSPFCSIHGDPYRKVYFIEDFSSTLKIHINGEDVTIPVGYDRYLSIIYKDYKNYLPISTRFDEFYRMTINVRKRINYMKSDDTGKFDFCKK